MSGHLFVQAIDVMSGHVFVQAIDAMSGHVFVQAIDVVSSTNFLLDFVCVVFFGFPFFFYYSIK